jgi:hypothetical protein
VIYNRLNPIKVKGKTNPIPVFSPSEKPSAQCIGLTPEGKIRFPWYEYPLDGSDITADDVAATAKSKVVHLCGIAKWSAIVRVQDMLGGTFNKALHQQEQKISNAPAQASAPAGSPFAEGGIIVMEGEVGMGKIELAEHICMHAAMRFQMMPIFGTMGPRPNGSVRLAVELLQSTLGVFRRLDSSMPRDDVQALTRVVPANLAGSLQILQAPLSGRTAKAAGNSKEILSTAVDVVIALLKELKNKTPILVVLQFGSGTSLFPKTMIEDEQTFWNVTAKLSQLVQSERRIAGLVLCRKATEDSNPAVKLAKSTNSFLTLVGLTDDNVSQYMSNYLNIPEQIIPSILRTFVTKMTLGNPLYIRETLDQLQVDQHIFINRGANGQARNVECKELAKINIAAWNHTAMVGGTVCTLESLEPIEAAALKMSTCFLGPFALPDLAASNCSPWGGATRFDALRLYRATRKLVLMGIIETVDSPPKDSRMDEEAQSPRNRPFGSTQYFQMNNMLIRTVGAAMVLESQRKAVKRNALIDRVLKQDLPKRMEELAAKKSVHHIPWYYEQAMRRMM